MLFHSDGTEDGTQLDVMVIPIALIDQTCQESRESLESHAVVGGRYEINVPEKIVKTRPRQVSIDTL